MKLKTMKVADVNLYYIVSFILSFLFIVFSFLDYRSYNIMSSGETFGSMITLRAMEFLLPAILALLLGNQKESDRE